MLKPAFLIEPIAYATFLVTLRQESLCDSVLKRLSSLESGFAVLRTDAFLCLSCREIARSRVLS